MASSMTPDVLRLSGDYTVYTADYEDEGVIDDARRVTYPDGRIAFIVEHDADDDDRWELRIESRDGRSFRGRMTSPDWDVEYTVTMDLWISPDDDQEWLLLGTWTDEDEGDIAWSITLFADDEESRIEDAR